MDNNQMYTLMFDALENKSFDLAREYSEKIVQIEPNSAEAHAWLAATIGKIIENGSVMEKLSMLPLLEEEINIALNLDPNCVIARRVNGTRLVYSPEGFGNNPNMAIEELNYAINNDIRDEEIFFVLALAYLQIDEREEAIKNFEKSLEYKCDYQPALDYLEELDLEVCINGIY